MTQQRGIGYYRRSTDKQEASIPQQMAWAEQACAREKVRIVKTFEDDAICGDKIIRRPGLQDMISYCEAEARAGRPIDCIICWKQDRLSRADATHTHAILARLIDAGIQRLLTSERWIDLNDDTEQILYSMSQAFSARGYVRTMSANVTRALAAKAARGLWPGGPPLSAFSSVPTANYTPTRKRPPGSVSPSNSTRN